MRAILIAGLSLTAGVALAVLLLLISTDPDETSGTEDIDSGVNAASTGDHEQAIIRFTRDILSGDLAGHDLADAYLDRGVVYDQLGDLDRAIADYEEAMRLEPEYALAYNNRGYALYKRGEYDRAIADADRALSLEPDIAAYFDTRGYAYAGRGNMARAIADLTEAIRLEPDNPMRYDRRAEIYTMVGRTKKAAQDLATADRLRSGR